MPTPNIAILTGTRAEFGIWTPILDALRKSEKLRPHLLVTGMHLQKQFGRTVDQIHLPIAAKIPMYKPRDTPADALARATAGIAKTLIKLRIDLLLLLGDRLEMLAGANAALATHTPIAHLHGGETAPGQWDEQIRHALTKLAHLHFPATKLAAARIRQMGEDPLAIHPIGAPALDTVANFLHSEFRIQNSEFSPSALCLLHPSSPDDTLEFTRTTLLLRALHAANIPFTAIGPNNDPGHAGILRAYRHANTPVTMSLAQSDFWRLLATSSFLIGNSSAGIIEAASFALPVINLGDRQKGRERNPNVLDLPWPQAATPLCSASLPPATSARNAGVPPAIGRRRSRSRNAGVPPASLRPLQSAIHFALTNKPFRRRVALRKNLYGDGHAADRLLKILERLHFPLPTTKSFHNLPHAESTPTSEKHCFP